MEPSDYLKNKIKALAEPLGFSNFLRQFYVETMLIGERVKFAVKGRPEPSSTILLVGSGRSGTTWISDVLCATGGIQEIFEPLNPYFTNEARALNLYQSIASNSCVSIYIRPNDSMPKWRDFLHRVMTGCVRTYMSDYVRNSFFPDRYIVKEIRANMMIGFIARHFHPRIIFIMRHPCAVVYSRLKVKWHADVKDILVQEKLVEDYLRPWLSEIEQIKDPLSSHALWWALENRVAIDQLTKYSHFFVYYETALLEPQKTVGTLYQWLGVHQVVPEKINIMLAKPSRMVQKNEPYQRQIERLSWWKNKLPEESQKKILEWAARLGIDNYDNGIFPVDFKCTTISAKI